MIDQFRASLKAQPEVLKEFFQGDVFSDFKESPQKPFFLRRVVNYFKALMKHNAFVEQYNWLKESYEAQLPLPPSSSRKNHASLFLLEISTLLFFLVSYFLHFFSVTCQGLIKRPGKFLRVVYAVTLLIVGLAAQVSAGAQETGSNTTNRTSIVGSNITNSALLSVVDEVGLVAPQRTAAQAIGSDATENGVLKGKNITGNSALLSVADQVGQALDANNNNQDVQNILLTSWKDRPPKTDNTEPVNIDVASFGNQSFANNTSSTKFSNVSEIAHRNHTVEISDIFRQEILRQFDEITRSYLQEITNTSVESGQPRLQSPRALARASRRPQCNVSKDKLVELNNIINNALSNASVSQTQNSNCKLSNNSQNCHELVNLIQCGVNHLKNGFIQAIADRAKPSFGEFVQLENALDEVSKQYANVIDDVRMSVSQDYQTEIDKLKTDLQTLHISFVKVVKELREERIKLCVSEISSGRIKSAHETIIPLKSYDDDKTLMTIIKTSYKSYGGLNIIENMIEFIKRLPQEFNSYTEYCYRNLFEEVKTNRDSTSPLILLLAHAATPSFGTSVPFGIYRASECRQFKNDINKEIEQGFILWTSQIRSNNGYEKITEFAKNHPDIFNANLKKLVDMAFSQNTNAEAILKFVRDLPHLKQVVNALLSLFENMKNNNRLEGNQLVTLAFRVKECINHKDYHTLEQSYQERLKTLKDNLPNLIVGLIWCHKNRYTIKNFHYNEYLYMANDMFNFKVLTWIPENVDFDAYWEIKTSDNGTSFTIRNTYHGGYLISTKEEHDKERHKLRTMGSTSGHDLWKFIPENGKFLIQNDYYNEFIYADGRRIDSDRRYVFAWIPNYIPDSVKDERKWIISCVK